MPSKEDYAKRPEHYRAAARRAYYANREKYRERKAAYMKEYYQQHREEGIARAAAWRTAYPEKEAARHRQWLARHKEERRVYKREYEQRYRRTHKNDPKMNARLALRYALRKGTVIKPWTCEHCHKRPSRRALHGHHEDYSRPLDVQWLCRPCHDQRHKKEH